VLWPSGQLGSLTILPMPVGANWAVPRAISDPGTIVGDFHIVQEAKTHPCAWTNGAVMVLPDAGSEFAYVTAINARGQIVGTLMDSGYQHAVTWIDGGLFDLTALAAGTGATIEIAGGIDDQGRIVAYGRTSDFSNAMLMLTPVPACGSADFNGDGTPGTDADIEAFFACLAGNCCPTCGSADFNGDGDTGTDADIESFFRVLAGGSC